MVIIMARVAYTDLFLNWAPLTTGIPTQAHIANLIINYYRQAYNIVYGLGTYASPDTDTSDPKTIIRSDEVFGELLAELGSKVQQWHESGISSSGEIIRMPNMGMSKELKTYLKELAGRQYDRIANLRCWGHDFDDNVMI